ncbi:13298_t:CDS:2, partial [Funneliformis mosseae]
MDKRKGKNRIDINSNMNSNQSDDDNSDVFYEAVTDVEVSTPQNNNVFYEAVTDVEVSKPQNNRYSIFTSLSLLSNSFSISGVTKKCKIIIGNKISNFIAPEDDSYTKIIFHVHFPKVHVGDPVIVGNIEELGNWNEPKVILKQHNKKHTSYWYSDPIQIPNVRFQVTVRYKYAVYSYNNLHLEYEGSGPDDDRELDIQRQQFDIWKNNSAYRINKINDYMFLNVIYGSENIKGMILDYDRILKQHQDLTLSVTNLQFINKRVSDKSIGKRLFLCFLLGHIAANNSERFELPREFQFFPLLQAFFTVDQYTFPSDSMHVVLKGIDLLIRHNIHYGLFEWLEIFSIAKNFDPQYKFINTISFSNCNNEKYIEDCFEKILKDKFDEYHRAKIIKWLMSQCNNAKYFSIIWRSSKKSDKKLRQDLEDNIKKMISEDEPANLHKNFTQLPDDIRDKVSDLFKKRVLDLLTKDRLAIWDEPKSKSISNLLNSKRLNWTKNEYIAVLRTVSTSNDDQLLSVFPSLLKNWKEMSNGIDYQITQLCINWYKKLMNRIGRTSSNSTAHRGESIIAVLENLSRICSLINEHSILGELIGLTFGHIRRFPEESILNTASNVEKFSSEAVHVFTKVIEEKIDSMELDRFIPLLNKMQVICGSTGKSLKIPNDEQYKIKEETCQTLVSFVNRNAKLPQLKDQWLNYEKDKYEQALEKINHKLGRIFGTLQKHERPVKNSEGRVMSDI